MAKKFLFIYLFNNINRYLGSFPHLQQTSGIMVPARVAAAQGLGCEGIAGSIWLLLGLNFADQVVIC